MSEFLEKRVKEIKSSMYNKQGEIDDLQGEIDDLQEAVMRMQKFIYNKNEKIDDLQGEIEDIEKELLEMIQNSDCVHDNIKKIQAGVVQTIECKDCDLFYQKVGTSLFDPRHADETYENGKLVL